MDFRRTIDTNSTAETAVFVQSEIVRELQAAAQDKDFLQLLPSGMPNDLCRSTVIGLVSDSASPYFAAKQALSRLHPSLLIVACFARQLNLVTGIIVNHPSMRFATAKMSVVVKFISLSTQWMEKLEVCMGECNRRRLAFLKRGETRCYSPYGTVRRILKLKGVLVAFGDKYVHDRSLLETNHGAEVGDLLRSLRVLHLADVRSRMLRPVFIEIGLVERRGSGVADVCASSGQLYACVLQLKTETADVSPGSAAGMAPIFAVAADASSSSLTHQLCTSVLQNLQWRLERYCEAPLLVLAHVLDPVRHTDGLQVGPMSFTSSEQLVLMFPTLADRVGLPPSTQVAAEHDACATAQMFMAYFVEGPGSVLAFYMESALGSTGAVSAEMSWRLSHS